MGRAATTVDERGFTLLELTVVLLVVALAASLTAPALGRSLEAVRVRAQVAGFSALLRHAREQAITSREPHLVEIDGAAGEVRVRTDDAVKRVRGIPPNWTIDAAQGNPVRFEPHGTSTGAAFRIVAGQTAFQVTVDALTGRVRNVRQ